MKAIIGIYAPRPGCGKTTLSRALRALQLRSCPMKFAGSLKDATYSILIDLIGDVDRVHRMIDGDLKSVPIPELDDEITPREFMQKLGTDFGRQMIHPELWIRIARAMLERDFDDIDLVVFDDVRFENEYEMLKDYGAYLVRLDRPEASDQFCEHPSEGALENFEFDAQLLNGGSIEDLQKTAPVILQRAKDHYTSWRLDRGFQANQ